MPAQENAESVSVITACGILTQTATAYVQEAGGYGHCCSCRLDDHQPATEGSPAAACEGVIQRELIDDFSAASCRQYSMGDFSRP